jgi:hypothetical protein
MQRTAACKTESGMGQGQLSKDPHPERIAQGLALQDHSHSWEYWPLLSLGRSLSFTIVHILPHSRVNSGWPGLVESLDLLNPDR